MPGEVLDLLGVLGDGHALLVHLVLQELEVVHERLHVLIDDLAALSVGILQVEQLVSELEHGVLKKVELTRENADWDLDWALWLLLVRELDSVEAWRAWWSTWLTWWWAAALLGLLSEVEHGDVWSSLWLWRSLDVSGVRSWCRNWHWDHLFSVAPLWRSLKLDDLWDWLTACLA